MSVDTQKLRDELDELLDDLWYPAVSRILVVIILSVFGAVNLILLTESAAQFTNEEMAVLNTALELVGFCLMYYLCMPFLKYGRQHWESILGKLTFAVGGLVSGYALLQFLWALSQV